MAVAQFLIESSLLSAPETKSGSLESSFLRIVPSGESPNSAASIERAVIAPVWLIVNADDGSEIVVRTTASARSALAAEPTPVTIAVAAPA